MSVLTPLRLWLRALLHRDRVDRDLDREMRAHLAMEIDENVRRGMSVADATRQALLAFGGVEQHKEAVRDELGTRWLAESVEDARLALRSFRRDAPFAATAVLTMAIGIGAATLVFSLANWVLLRPVRGVPSPHGLVSVGFHRVPNQPTGASYQAITELARTPSLAALGGSARTSVQYSATGVAARQLVGETIVGAYFGVLGLQPQLGRFFQPSELGVASDARVVVISDRLWRSDFGADRSVVGKRLSLNGADFIVCGVAPRAFAGIDRVGHTDFWLTPASYQVSRHDVQLDLRRSVVTPFNIAIGRLRGDATPAVVEQQMRAELARMAATDSALAARYISFPPHVALGVGTAEYSRPYIEATLRLLTVVVAVVLLISCANAASLLLFRGVSRRGEMAVRRALGASTTRLFRLHLAEGLLLGMLGGACGLLVAGVLRILLRAQALPGLPPIDELELDWRVIAFAISLALVSGAVFAVVPAFVAMRADYATRLKEAARSDAGSGSARARRGLVVLQIGASMTLVVAGLLFARTLRALHGVDTGVDVEHTAAFVIDPSGQGYDAARVAGFQNHVLERIAASPGIDVVTLASNAPFSGSFFSVDLRPAGYDGTQWPAKAKKFLVTPDYFAALGIPLLAGQTVARTAAEADTTVRANVVLSRATARALFGLSNPLGRVIEERQYRGTRAFRVAGVAGDTRVTGLRGEYDLVMYAPFANDARGGLDVFITRSALPAASVDRTVRAALAEVDAAVPVARSYVMGAGIERAITMERLFARLVTTLAVVTVLLMAVGLYGVIAYFVAERRREIGVRVALGGSPASIVALVVRQSLGLVAGGLLVGTVASVALARAVTTYLFGVSPLDAPTYAVAGVMLVALGALAAAVPARAAARVNPVQALRHQ